MRFASLGSGSEGNALVVEARQGTTTTRILLDCGFSLREVQRRLARLAIELDQIDAVVVTHEHTDHVGCALKLARTVRVPVLASWGTARMIGANEAGIDLRVIRGGAAVSVGDLELLPYTVPHDAREPLQFVLSDGRARLGVLTDAGTTTPHIRATLNGCDALILECNHDREMLMKGRYPPALKQRIGGSHGHLSNNAARAVLRELDCSRLRHVVAAHLSEQNNLPELAARALADGLDTQAADIVLAGQREGFPWLDA